MSPNIFNACILVGWLLAVAGVAFFSIGYALVVAGASLVVLTFGVAFMFGVVKPRQRPKRQNSPPSDAPPLFAASESER